MPYEEYFDLSSDNPEEETPQPTPPKEELTEEEKFEERTSKKEKPKEEVSEEKVVEEKKDDFTEVLEDMVLNPSDIPEGLTKEKVLEILKEHKEAEKSEKERLVKEAELSKLEQDKQEMVKILQAKRPRRLGEFETETEAEIENRKNWEKQKEMQAKFEDERWQRTHTDIPPEGLKLPSKEELDKMSIKKRTAVFEKIGLLKKTGRPPEIK